MKHLTVEQIKHFKRIIRKYWRAAGANSTKYEVLYDRLNAELQSRKAARE